MTHAPAPQRRLDASRHPVAYFLMLGTSFIGIYWLLDPLFERFGLPGDLSRSHLLFVGSVYAAIMTWRSYRVASKTRHAD